VAQQAVRGALLIRQLPGGNGVGASQKIDVPGQLRGVCVGRYAGQALGGVVIAASSRLDRIIGQNKALIVGGERTQIFGRIGERGPPLCAQRALPTLTDFLSP